MVFISSILKDYGVKIREKILCIRVAVMKAVLMVNSIYLTSCEILSIAGKKDHYFSDLVVFLPKTIFTSLSTIYYTVSQEDKLICVSLIKVISGYLRLVKHFEDH